MNRSQLNFLSRIQLREIGNKNIWKRYRYKESEILLLTIQKKEEKPCDNKREWERWELQRTVADKQEQREYETKRERVGGRVWGNGLAKQQKICITIADRNNYTRSVKGAWNERETIRRFEEIQTQMQMQVKETRRVIQAKKRMVKPEADINSEPSAAAALFQTWAAGSPTTAPSWNQKEPRSNARATARRRAKECTKYVSKSET